MRKNWREKERQAQGALMFVVQSGDLNTAMMLKLGCCDVAETFESFTAATAAAAVQCWECSFDWGWK